jgi:ribosomal-protein-alanine N-acetyltransferase
MQIIRMTEREVPAVAKLEQELFSMPWSEQGFLDTLPMDNVIFLVATQEDIVCGYCGVYLAADEGEITNVAVAPSFRRRGIARMLMKQLIDEAFALGISQIALEVRVSNEGAIQLYKQLGFTSYGVRKNFYERPAEDAYIMLLRQ